MLKSIILSSIHLDMMKQFCDHNLNHTTDKQLINFLLQTVSDNDPEAAVSAIIEDGEIAICQVGYTINKAWNKKNVLPFWVVGRLVTKLSVTDVSYREDVIVGLGEHFESLGYYSCYIATKINKNLLNSDIEENYVKFIRRAFNIVRYDSKIEKILYSDFDYTALSDLYRTFSHKTCEENKCIIISRLDLKPKYQVRQSNTI